MGHYGLNPTLRGLKGIGFGRALPAPFGFDSCLKGDGVNDNMNMPGWVGQAWPTNSTIEFWTKLDATPSNSETAMLRMTGADGGINLVEFSAHTTTPTLRLRNVASGGGSLTTGSGLTLGNTYYVAIRNTNGAFDICINGIGGASSVRTTGSSAVLFKAGVIVTELTLLKPSFGQFYPHKFDEFRFYNRAISDSEVVANYNSGIGENPQDVVGLVTWYKFTQFETLDFSAAQDNSDLRLGIRDSSGGYYHGQPVNMVTTPGAGYVLQTF